MSWLIKISAETLQSITNRWKATVPGLVIFVYEKDDKIILSSLIVPKDFRNRGFGSQIMKDLTSYADSVGKRIELSPGTKDKYNGTTSRGRLVRFYKRFNFKENKGRNKDFRTSETMLRTPNELV